MQGIAILACARTFGIAGLVTFGAPAQVSASPGQQINRTSATSSMAIQQPATSLPESAAAAVDEGTRLLDGGDMEAARPQFERALVLARVEGNRQVEGRAHRGLGVILQRRANYPAAKEALERALTILEETGPTLQLASTHTALGTVEYYLKHWDATREHYLKALDAFEALGDLAEQGNLHYNLSFIAVDRDDALRSIERGVDLARKGGAAQLEGQLLHAWSDNLFARGRLAEAMKKLEPAISLLEAAGETARGRLAFALTSLGRLHRAHGHHEQALNAYRQALHIQEALGDRFGMVQSLNAIGVAFAYLGRPREARPGLERALELARGTGSPSLIDFVTVSLATILIRTGDSARGVEMLEQIVARDSTNHDVFKQLANGYLDTGRYARAIESATSAIVKAREQGQLDQIQDTLEIRARAREQLGQHAEALADTREAIAHIERVRTDLIPTDAMKRGFSGEHQALFTLAIGLLNRLGRGREALDVAEQARGRAFADLLASRETVLSAAARREEGAPSTRVTRGADSRSDGLVRGGEAGASPPVAALHSDRDLRSFASAAPLSTSELTEIAAHLHSTLISFWVAPEATYIWVVPSTGEVAAVRVDVTERRLKELVRQTWTIGDRSAPRGDIVATEPEPALPALDTAERSVDADQLDERWTPRLRGDGLLSLGTSALVASRALHRLLVEPIQRLLPAEPGSLLTIIPHGPLFLLSFAALQNPNGEYLIERHAIHYAPAGVVLRLAEQHKVAARPLDRGYLLLADPRTLPTLPGGKPLPRLPGTQREITRVAGLMPTSRVTSLVGAQATEQEIRRVAGNRSVIHLATHGVIRTDDPLESFLALDVTQGSGRATTAQNDGRLTAREIYDIDLNADLVVLSACRTGLGAISGDGVMGLARAFLYAGTPSVVATLWDVADEPSALMMPSFYRALRRMPDKAQALRSAQLTLLKELRAGTVKVSGASGPITLREHPVLWAGFVLVGQP